ncbi:DUF3011 domain-containing protein [Parvularcula sp. IMCC14364]|uniref:DUF3011 domain-containing protein n=1 Tax=Parvularcula sp. IMCC14364 TaxID=3067902 RepID=UPI0027405ECA|nr:DUF3011 domain-containing protein [Parvularcula sp. IMCC14364]
MDLTGRWLRKPLKYALALIAPLTLGTVAAQAADNNSRYGSERYGYNNYGNSNNQSEFVRCKSEDFRKRTCRLNGRIRNVSLYDRESKAQCRRGNDWGYRNNQIWVQNGCRGVFRVTYEFSRNGYDNNGYGNNNGYGYGNNGYGNNGYGNNGYGYGNNYGLSRDIAIGNCIARAETQLRRDGFRRARFERVQRASQGRRGGGWNLELIFRVPHDNHFHYPVFGCEASRDYTRLTRYDFGDGGRQCGFNFRLSGY